MAIKEYEVEQQAELKSDIKTILASEKTNMSLLKMCLDMDLETTRNTIAEDEQIKANIERLFTEPSSYWIADEICKKKMLKDVINAEEKFQEMLGKLEQLPGKEIVKIFRTAAADTEDVQKTELLKSVFRCYKEQTTLLHEHDGGDVFYTELGCSKNCEYWNGYRKDLLDIVGMYQDNPAVEKLAEEKVARIFSYYMYPEKNKDGEYKQKGVFYASIDGAQEYANRMIESIRENIDSIKSEFYLEYAQEVFSRAANYEMAAGVILQVIPELMPKHPQITSKLLAVLEKCHIEAGRRNSEEKLQNMVKNEILENPSSEASEVFVERAAGIFQHRYVSIVREIAAKYKEQYPELCDKLCRNLVEVYENQGNEQRISIYDLSDVYKIYHNKGLAEVITRKVDDEQNCGNNDFVVYAEYAEQTGLKCYEDLLNRSPIDNTVAFRMEIFDNTCKHDILFKHLQKAQIKSLDIKMNSTEKEYVLDCSKLSSLTSLIKVKGHKGIKLENCEKLLELPNLKDLNVVLNEAQATKLYEILMQKKPENLHILGYDIDFTKKQAENLIEKYPNLLVKKYPTLDSYDRNECVINALDAEEPLFEAIKGNVLKEYLSVVPKEKQPTMVDFMKKASFPDVEYATYFEFLRSKSWNDERYRECMVSTAYLLDDQKLKAEVALWSAAENGDIVEYLKKLPPEKRPTIEQMSENVASYGKKANIWDIIENKYNSDIEKKNKLVKDVLTSLGVSEKDADKLPKNKNITTALEEWQMKQKQAESRAATRAAFEIWKQNQMGKK